jgi:PKHD-type hydroxylase
MTVVAWALRESDRIHKTVTVGGLFTAEETQKIKALAVELEVNPPLVGTKGENKEVRKCQVKWLRVNEECSWVYKRLVDAIYRVNSQYFNLNLYGIETLQYTIYNAADSEFYGPHKDTFPDVTNRLIRKLTFSIQLSDPSEYEGGELVTDAILSPNVESKAAGDVIFFLSDLVHEAKPVTKGVRHVLVGWVVGPPMA